jgi:C-terminal processing protease CtpA/Prc
MRTVFQVLLLFFCCHGHSQTKFQEDFEYYWKTIDENFGYFDTQKTNWAKVKEIYQPQVDTITTTRSFVQLLELINNELYNGHISLNTNLPSSNRLIPTGADLWVKYYGKQFIISSIREGFGADQSGLKPGMIITRFNGEAIEHAIHYFLPKSVVTHDTRMHEYAANMLLAGRHNTKRTITAKWKGIERNYYPDSLKESPTGNPPLLEYNRLPHGLAYIKITNSLGDNNTIRAFDEVLDGLLDTKGLVLDLRETPSGGNTTVARAIMGRFIEKTMPYQKHSLPAEEKQYGVKRSWVEYVSPRGKTYKKPLVILVNRWTGSMGEGIAIGFDGMKRAEIVGEKMAGLIGAIYSFNLPETNIGFSLPVEKLFHVNGSPRENFTPKYLLKGNENYLPFAIQVLRKKIASR